MRASIVLATAALLALGGCAHAPAPAKPAAPARLLAFDHVWIVVTQDAPERARMLRSAEASARKRD